MFDIVHLCITVLVSFTVHTSLIHCTQLCPLADYCTLPNTLVWFSNPICTLLNRLCHPAHPFCISRNVSKLKAFRMPINLGGAYYQNQHLLSSKYFLIWFLLKRSTNSFAFALFKTKTINRIHILPEIQ